MALFLALYASATAVAEGPLRWALAAPVAVIPFLRWIFVSRLAWLGVFFALALLAPPLPIALGNSGPHPCVVLAGIGFLIGFFRRREWCFERSGLAFTLALFVVIVTLSTALAAIYSGPEIAAQSLARAGLAAIGVYIFFYTSAGPGRFTRLSLTFLYTLAAASAAFACLDFYYQFPAPAGFGSQFIWLDSGVYRRAQGVFYEAGTLGNFCAFCLTMTVVALLREIGNRVVLVAGMVLFAAGVILSYSRGSALNAAVALLTLTFLERSRFTRRGVAYAGVALATCAAIAYATFAQQALAYWTRLWFSFSNLFSYSDRILGGRLDAWTTLTKFLAGNPWYAILGVGYKTLPYSNFIGTPVVADNMYLSMLVEGGVVGLAALLAFNFAILRAGYRAAVSGDREKSFYGVGIFCFWMGQMVQMFSADVLTFWRVLPVYFWVLAMAVRR